MSTTACDSCHRRWGTPWRPNLHADICADCAMRAYQQLETARVAKAIFTVKQILDKPL